MRNWSFFLLSGIAVWRVGSCVGWNYTTLTDKLDNDREFDSTKAGETCEDIGGLTIRRWLCDFNTVSCQFRSEASDRIEMMLPSPHSELVAGMVLGENRFKFVPTYNDVLKKVGLIHVVVVSGYNISLVFTVFTSVLGSKYKPKNMIIGLVGTFIYAGISGFGIPALRAWVMGSIAAVYRFNGLPSEGVRFLIFTALVMLAISPEQLFSISFLLSFMATFGVMAVQPVLLSCFKRIQIGIKSVFISDFVTSISAQIMVLPILTYYFGTLSLGAVVSNPLVLWVVPWCTILGGGLVVATFISPLLAEIFAFIVYPFLDFFVVVSEQLSKFSHASVPVKFSAYSVFAYYLVVFSFIKLMNSRL